MNILVIQKQRMGDILVTSIIFEQLRKHYPKARLHYLINKSYAPIIKHHPCIDELLYFQGFFTTLRTIWKGKYAIIIDAYATLSTALLCWIAGLGSKRISLHKKYTAFFYTATVSRNDTILFPQLTTALEHRLRLLLPLGIPITVVFPKIYLSEEEKQAIYPLFTKYKIDKLPLIMISTFGSTPAKTYPLPYMAQVIQTIAQHTNATLLCNYLPSQQKDFDQLYTLLNETTKKKICQHFPPLPLRQYIAVLAHCRALIGNEGGTTNISKALGIPTISIYAPFVKGWDWRTDEVTNIAIHAQDYHIKSYQYFTPILFEDKIITFLKNHSL